LPMPDNWKTYPIHDELTESAYMTEYGLDNYIDVMYPYAGYWHDVTSSHWNMILLDQGVKVAGQSILDIAQLGHNFLAFYFEEAVDLTSCRYVKYWQKLSDGHTGRCYFALFGFNEAGTEVYCARHDYDITISDLPFCRQELDWWQRSDWNTDPQFEMGNVAGFLFAAEAINGTTSCAMWIDTPKLYSSSVSSNPLPVGEKIDEAEGNASRIRMLTQLWHGNVSDGCEHWLLKTFLEDQYYLSHPWTAEHPSFITLTLRLPGDAQEPEPSHWPQAGYVGS